MAICKLIDLRGHWTTDTLVTLEEGFSRSKTEEHIETYRDVVLVISDIEADKFVALAILPLIEREHQTTELLLRAVHLEILLAPILKPGVRQMTGIADGHRDSLALLQIRSIEVAGTKED